MIDILHEVAENFQPILETKLHARLDKREKKVLDWLLLQYQDETKRRWYDPFHILFSTNFAIDLIDQEKLSRLIVPGIMLHDIGYFAIEDKTMWSSAESRILHMQEGTPLAARILYESGYSPQELEKILGMISVHDNPYIGIEIKGRDRLGLRDCDRVWVMHLLSYYKDLASKPEGFHNPTEFLYDRLTQFYGWEHPFGIDKTITVSRVKTNASRIETPTYLYTQNYVQRQFECRLDEQKYIEKSDTDEFAQYLFAQIQRE